MDTRFWGPSGWRLLHLIAAEPFASAAHKHATIRWLKLLEYALPCKYCRASFHDYLRAQPLSADTPDEFGRWMYDIHNRVNAKLRGQGLLTESDPDWSAVRDRYRDLHRGLCDGSPLLGWDFLTSVAFSTPGPDYRPQPMDDLPDGVGDGSTLDAATRNRYNLMTRTERLGVLAAWWRLFPSILPCRAWRAAWKAAIRRVGNPPLRQGRDAVMRWMWRVEESVCGALKCPTPHPGHTALEREVSAFESGCATARRGKTCRARRRNRVRTLRQKRGVVVL